MKAEIEKKVKLLQNRIYLLNIENKKKDNLIKQRQKKVLNRLVINEFKININ